MSHETQLQIVTIATDASLADAARTMRDERVGSLVVVDASGTGVGMLTDRDLTVRAVAWGRDPGETTVESVMSSPLEALDGDHIDFESAVRAMRSNGRRRLPVCASGKPIGMITFDDLLDTLAGWLGDLAEIQAPRLREATSRRETSALLAEVQRGVQKVREIGWKTQHTIFDDLDALEKRVKRALDTMP